MVLLSGVKRFCGKLGPKFLILALASLPAILPAYDPLIRRANDEYKSGQLFEAYKSYCTFFMIPHDTTCLREDFFCALAGKTMCLYNLCGDYGKEFDFEWDLLHRTLKNYSKQNPKLMEYVIRNTPYTDFLIRLK